jgi:hypothetical protein
MRKGSLNPVSQTPKARTASTVHVESFEEINDPDEIPGYLK